MRRLPIPALTEDFTADPVELFLDLAYVFAFSQLVAFIVHEPTWRGLGKATLIFLLLWLPWQQLTWATNAVSGSGRPIRFLLLAATVASIPMAAATQSALALGGAVFAVALTVIMIIGWLIQTMSAERGTGYARAVAAWVLPNALAIAFLLVGATTDGNTRIAWWCSYLVIVLVSMAFAGQGEWPVRMGHFAERHGLLVIIALGEVIVAIGIPVVAGLQEGEGFPALTLWALLTAGLVATLIWWAYFDRFAPAIEYRGTELTTRRERGRYVRDQYTWAHAPIIAGIVLMAVGIEDIALHPSEVPSTAFRWFLVGGLMVLVAGMTAGTWRAYRVILWERVGGTVAAVVTVAIAQDVDGVALLTYMAGILAAVLVAEHLRKERPSEPAVASGPATTEDQVTD